MSYLVHFDTIPWLSPMPGVRHKVYARDGRVLRLVEYSPDLAPHWCSKGHVGQILSGRLEIEFKHGTETFQAGDGVFIPQGPEHAHRATPRSASVTALFVEDE